jgi:hypothetical protein
VSLARQQVPLQLKMKLSYQRELQTRSNTSTPSLCLSLPRAAHRRRKGRMQGVSLPLRSKAASRGKKSPCRNVEARRSWLGSERTFPGSDLDDNGELIPREGSTYSRPDPEKGALTGTGRGRAAPGRTGAVGCSRGGSGGPGRAAEGWGTR